MLGQSALTRGSSSSSDNRVFVYEVEGLRQNDQTDNNRYQIRNSSTILIQVPYNRMNDEMRRIARLGGKIVGIRPASEVSESASES
ncbi:phycocyanin associated linker protein [Calothrix sp. NIES-2100]|uniref:phycobilisome linker polypeptide n=1 Tax=Calothrix sp. NIES-2100 TaxID=1954172 RepID=UPI000B5E498D|nr:phycocyanin associated linker protein [Calothrix sp. NIES-2100]